MEDSPSTDEFDTGIIVTCVEDKYIGFLLGSDENYLYMKYTLKMKKIKLQPTEEAIVAVQRIIEKRPLLVLKYQVARKFMINSARLSRAELTRMLAEETVVDVLEEKDPEEVFIPQPHPIKIALSHGDVLSFASLSDATTAAILSGLDFPAGSEYNEDHDNSTDTSTQDHSAEDGKS